MLLLILAVYIEISNQPEWNRSTYFLSRPWNLEQLGLFSPHWRRCRAIFLLLPLFFHASAIGADRARGLCRDYVQNSSLMFYSLESFSGITFILEFDECFFLNSSGYSKVLRFKLHNGGRDIFESSNDPSLTYGIASFLRVTARSHSGTQSNFERLGSK